MVLLDSVNVTGPNGSDSDSKRVVSVLFVVVFSSVINVSGAFMMSVTNNVAPQVVGPADAALWVNMSFLGADPHLKTRLGPMMLVEKRYELKCCPHHY